MEKTKRRVGRPRGTKQTEEARKKISQSLKNYFSNLSEEDKAKWKKVNELRKEVWKKYYEITKEEKQIKK